MQKDNPKMEKIGQLIGQVFMASLNTEKGQTVADLLGYKDADELFTMCVSCFGEMERVRIAQNEKGD